MLGQPTNKADSLPGQTVAASAHQLPGAIAGKWYPHSPCAHKFPVVTVCGMNRREMYGQQVLDGLQGHSKQIHREKPHRAHVWPMDPDKTAKASTKSPRKYSQGGKAHTQGVESQANKWVLWTR